jgi:hypothetical protein
MSHIAPTVAAYAAGLFDGEGHISIQTPLLKENGRRYHRLMLSLVNTDKRLVDWLIEQFGGYVSYHRRPTNGHQDSWGWATNSQVAEQFLRAIQPYAVLKAEQIEIALALRATRIQTAGCRGLPKRPTDAIYAEREALRLRLQALTKRGVQTP